MMKKYAVIYCRVSTPNQTKGESLDNQEMLCRAFALGKNLKVKDEVVFKEPYSGRKDDRPELKNMLEYVKNNSDHIQAVIIRDIDRMVRGGVEQYSHLKKTLSKYGVDLIDTTGIIQPQKNALEHTGFEYDWSKYTPSESAEIMKAHSSKEEVRNILTRTIGAEIQLAKKGFSVREANIGLKNTQIIDTDGKEKITLEPHPVESKWIIEMFKLRADGIYSDDGIVEKVNAMGFKTRLQNKRDKNGKIIGKQGGLKLDKKMMGKYLMKPVYAGIRCEKWTNHLPIKIPYFSGIISIDTFNKANRGKIAIVEHENEQLEIVNNKTPKQISHKKNNPLYPYKGLVLCPECKKPFLASASTGKSGKKHPAYHCSRGHKRYGIRKKVFEDNIESLLKRIKINKAFLKLFEAVFIKTWEQEKGSAETRSIDYGKRVIELKQEQKSLYEQWKMCDSEFVKKKLAEEMEEKETDIAIATQERNKAEYEDVDITSKINYALYFMEHLEDFLLPCDNLEEFKVIFSLIFEKFPTYEEIKNGTPKLSLVFDLLTNKKATKDQLVARTGLEPVFLG